MAKCLAEHLEMPEPCCATGFPVSDCPPALECLLLFPCSSCLDPAHLSSPGCCCLEPALSPLLQSRADFTLLRTFHACFLCFVIIGSAQEWGLLREYPQARVS